MVLIFDLDGVLVNSTFFSDILIEVLCQKFQEQNLCIDKPTIYQEILRRFVKKLGEKNNYYAYDWDMIVREYLEEYKIRWTSGIEDFFKSDELLKYTYLYNDVEILEWLLEKGYNMTVLTNGLPKYQDQVIEKLGLQRFFKRITMPNPDEIKLIKPQPEIFRLATRGFQESESHVMIGDSLYFDIYGAKKVGYKAIWLIRKLPKKLKELSIQYRTDKINENKKFLLKYILRSAPFLTFSSTQNNLNEFKPDHIICNLQELKELF